ncbi:MAG: hypothetical protein KJ574_03005 [Nanoarchaeota archaeon]|nr:hypothetical protein [Nanoarchaeota archaeon]
MAYFSYADFVEAEKRKDLVVADKLEFGPISLDIRIGRLMQIKYIQVDPKDMDGMPNDEFVRKYTKEYPLVDGAWNVTPYTWLLWEPVESIEIAEGLMGDIVSRSSWARLGIRTCAKDVDHFILKRPDIRRKIKPLCSLVSTGTTVNIRPGDPIAQLFAMTSPEWASRQEVEDLIARGEFRVEKDGRRLGLDELVFHGGLVMTMADDILVYNPAHILDPQQPREDAFERVRLSAVNRTTMPKRAFFLSTSEQHIEIPAGYIAELLEGLSIGTACEYTRTFNPEFGPMPYRSHANSPYVGPSPVFRGRVVFENSMIWEDELHPGMKQSELFLHRLVTPCGYRKESRYAGQDHTQESLVPLDKDT